jgi:hypothetical protein
VAELVLVAGVEAGWLATDGRPDASTASLLLALAAATTMGMQSAVTISSGVRGASTTVARSMVRVGSVSVVELFVLAYGRQQMCLVGQQCAAEQFVAAALDPPLHDRVHTGASGRR